MDLFEFEASMIYRAVRTTQRNLVSGERKKQASKQTTTTNKQLGQSRKYLNKN